MRREAQPSEAAAAATSIRTASDMDPQTALSRALLLLLFLHLSLPGDRTPLYHYSRGVNPADKPAWAEMVTENS